MSEYFADEEFQLNTLDVDLAVNDLYTRVEFGSNTDSTVVIGEVG